jgi:hypothetical protein
MNEIAMSSKAGRKERLWIDGLFLALFLIDWAFCLFLVFSNPEPITGGYGFAIPFGWAPYTGIFLIPTLVVYVFYQGWLLYRKLSRHGEPYRHRLRRVTLLAFLLTFAINGLAVWIMSGAFQTAG